MPDRRLIAVDFDKTITTGEGEPYWVDPYDEEPDQEMIELVNDLYKAGHIIHIWTARREDARDVTSYWLDEWDVMHHALVMQKHSPDLFIDDKAIHRDQALRLESDDIEQLLSKRGY